MSHQENESLLEEDLDTEYDLGNEDEEALLAGDEYRHLQNEDNLWQEETYEDETGAPEDILDLGEEENMEEDSVILSNDFVHLNSTVWSDKQYRTETSDNNEFLQLGGVNSKDVSEERGESEDEEEEEEEEEDEEDNEGRGRFRSERASVALPKAASRTGQCIPETLDGVQVEDAAQHAANNRANNRRRGGPRMRGRGRGMPNGRRPTPMFGRQQVHQQFNNVHPMQLQQKAQQMQLPPNQQMHVHQMQHQQQQQQQHLIYPQQINQPSFQYQEVPENVPSMINQAPTTTNPPPVTPALPQKILINPHFKGPLPGRPQFWVPQQSQQEYSETRLPAVHSLPPTSQPPPQYMQQPSQVQAMPQQASTYQVQYNQPPGSYQTAVDVSSWSSTADSGYSAPYHPPPQHQIQHNPVTHPPPHLPPQTNFAVGPPQISPHMPPPLPPPVFNRPPPPALPRMQQPGSGAPRMQQTTEHSWPHPIAPQSDYQFNQYNPNLQQTTPPGTYTHPTNQPPPRYPPLRPQMSPQYHQPQPDYSVPPPNYAGDPNMYPMAPRQVGPRLRMMAPELHPPRPRQPMPHLPRQQLHVGVPRHVSPRPVLQIQQSHTVPQGKVEALKKTPQLKKLPVHQRLQKRGVSLQTGIKRQHQSPSAPVLKQPRLSPGNTKDSDQGNSPEKQAEIAGMTQQELFNYNLKIREQKLMREEVLRRKEKRRRQLIEEKQSLQDKNGPGENSEVQGSAIATIVNRSTIEPLANEQGKLTLNSAQNKSGEETKTNPVQIASEMKCRGIVKRRVLPMNTNEGNNIAIPVAGAIQGQLVPRGRGFLQRVGANASTRGLTRGAATRGVMPGTMRGAARGARNFSSNIIQQSSGVTLNNLRGMSRGQVLHSNSVVKTIIPGGTNMTVGGISSAFRGGGRGRTVVMSAAEAAKLTASKAAAAVARKQDTDLATKESVTPQQVPQNVTTPTTSVLIENLSTATSRQKLIKMSQPLKLTSVAMEQNTAKLTFATIDAAAQFHQRFNRKMVDLSLVSVKYV